MSNIPAARALLVQAMNTAGVTPNIRAMIKEALALMTRESPTKRTKAHPVTITPAMRRRINALANTGYSNHEIAVAVGLPNMGRVSEILTGKR